jgi:hypothetical protein
LQQHVEIRLERRPRSTACASKGLRGPSPLIVQQGENSHSALSLEEAPSSVIISLATRWIRMPAHYAPSLLPGFATFRSLRSCAVPSVERR